jgi:hypothetical protein
LENSQAYSIIALCLEKLVGLGLQKESILNELNQTHSTYPKSTNC